MIRFNADLYSENYLKNSENTLPSLKFRTSEHFSRPLTGVFQIFQAILIFKKWQMRKHKKHKQLTFFTMFSD